MGKKSLIGICLSCFATLCALSSEPEHLIGDQLVEDPYYWLEGESHETEQWLEGQKKIFEQAIVRDERRAGFLERLEEMTDLPEYGFPIERDGRLFYTGRGGIWCDDRQLVDMESWPESWGLTSMLVEGGTLAYGISENGSDLERWFLVDVASGQPVGEEIEGILYVRPVLGSDGRRMFYWRADGDSEALYCHQVGTHQIEDRWLEGVTDGGELHLIGAEQSLLIGGEGWQLVDIETGASQPLAMSGSSRFIGEQGDQMLFLDLEGRHSLLSLSREGEVSTVIPQSEAVIDDVALAGGRLAVVFQRRGIQSLSIYDLRGNFEREVELPGLGTVSRPWRNFHLSASPSSRWLYFHYQDLATPPTVYRCNVESGVMDAPFGEQPMRDDVVAEQILVAADDGVEIPVTLYHRRDLDLDQAHPALLYGYGGFSLALTPVWSPMQLLWIEDGGVYAVANIRGGGEYGEEWHQAALGADRQRAYDDFIQVGEHLKEGGVASQLAIYGRSNGGLLTAVCALQQPGLFDAVISSVGVHDLIRFPDFTAGSYWINEYGDPESVDDLSHLLRFSPYHNVAIGQSYPPMLITTGAHDDRVVPAHSYKLAAMLQERGGGETLLRVDPTGAHHPGDLDGENLEHADMLVFLAHSFEMSPPATPA